MKLTTVIIAALGSLFSLSALEMDQMRLDKLNPAKDYELKYEMTEVVTKTGKAAELKASAEIFINVYKVADKADPLGRQYKINVRDKNDSKQNMGIKFNSTDGGKSFKKITILTKEGKEREMTDAKELASYNILTKTGVKISAKSNSREDYSFSGKSVPVSVFRGTDKNSHTDEKMDLVLKIDSELEEKNFVSDSKDLPILVKSEYIVNNHRYAYHAQNPEIVFPRMEQRANIVKTIKLVSVKESASVQKNDPSKE